MVALVKKGKMDESGTDSTRSSKQDDTSDGAASPMVSDGDRASGTSSPPSATDMSFVEDAASGPSVPIQEKHSPPDGYARANLRNRLESTSSESQELKPSAARNLSQPIHYTSYSSLEGSLQDDRLASSSSTPQAPHLKRQTAPSSRKASKTADIPSSQQATASSVARASKVSIRGTKFGSTKPKPGTALRRGKWTVEEEAYVARVIQDFNSGFLDAPAGTTLRTYLSEKLKCDPMRITKKFTGDACIGKRVFHPAVRSSSNTAAIDNAQAELDSLERRWRRRLDMQQRESAKKAAASAAVAAAASSGRSVASIVDQQESTTTEGPQQHGSVAQTASWLDRAKLALKTPSDEAPSDESNELQNQMHEVQRLIHEGPVIQQTVAQVLDEGASNASSGDDEPADKRMKTAEDAEALVGFLRSVRASAASGEEF